MSPELQHRILAAVGKTAAPIMLLYAANDYDTTPGKDICGARLARETSFAQDLSLDGKIPDDGHNLIYVDISELTSNDFCSFSTTPLDGTHLTGKRWDY